MSDGRADAVADAAGDLLLVAIFGQVYESGETLAEVDVGRSGSRRPTRVSASEPPAARRGALRLRRRAVPQTCRLRDGSSCRASAAVALPGGDALLGARLLAGDG